MVLNEALQKEHFWTWIMLLVPELFFFPRLMGALLLPDKSSGESRADDDADAELALGAPFEVELVPLTGACLERSKGISPTAAEARL